jgi:DNA-binding MarR family transcriptional regulator
MRLSAREVQAMEAVFALRTTAQQVDNVLTEWVAGTAGSPARFQILMLLWAVKGRGVPHKDIVAVMGVTRATVSELMAALEREGFIRSSVDRDDRRKLLATLTPRGHSVIDKAVENNIARFRTAFAPISAEELTTLTALLRRVQDGFGAGATALRS